MLDVGCFRIHLDAVFKAHPEILFDVVRISFFEPGKIFNPLQSRRHSR